MFYFLLKAKFLFNVLSLVQQSCQESHQPELQGHVGIKINGSLYDHKDFHKPLYHQIQ